MKVIIEIPDHIYGTLLETGKYGYYAFDAKKAIKKGKRLPKGHGDLIDRSKIYKAIPAEEDNCTGMGMTLEEMDAYNEGIDAMYSLVEAAKPIIEADKIESEV